MSDYQRILKKENRKRVEYLRNCKRNTEEYLKNSRTIRHEILGSFDEENEGAKTIKQEINKKYSVMVKYINNAESPIKEYFDLTRDSIVNIDKKIDRAIEVYENDYNNNLKGFRFLSRLSGKLWLEIKDILLKLIPELFQKIKPKT